MITDVKKWHYLAVKNHDAEFYCLNFLHSFRTKNRLKKHKNVCKSHDYSYRAMPKEYNKKLKHINGQKCIKVLFIVFANFEFWLEKIDICYNNPGKSSTTKLK